MWVQVPLSALKIRSSIIRQKLNQYRFDWNDIRAGLTILNVVCILVFGRSIGWIGLAVAAFGLVKDIFVDKQVNGALMHFSNIFFNLYVLGI